MKTSRQRVLDYIRAHRAVTNAELCQALDSTEANMRHHITILKQQGLVQVIGSRPAAPNTPSGAGARGGGERPPHSPSANRRGRPAQIFGPVDPAPAEHLIVLAAALLDETLPHLAAHEQDAFLGRVAARLAEQLAGLAEAPLGLQPARPRQDHLTARLFTAVEHLNRARYQARWEARPDAPRLILGRCPFGDLPLRNPEVCRLDARLLEILLSTPVEQLKRLERDARGLPYCLFRLST